MTDSTLITAKGGESGRKINDPQMLPVGATLQGGKYKVVAQLAHGGFGMTYKVFDRDRDKFFALKELFIRGVNERLPEQTSISLIQTSDAEHAEQNRNIFDSQIRLFKREGDRMIDLQHPNIVRVYTIFEENNTAYYVMDFIEGESLSSTLKRLKSPIAENDVMNLLNDILSALEYIHERNLHHLDIKPANIMVGVDGHAHIIDFGASKQIKSTDQRTSTLSAMALTRGYAPSEQVDQNSRLIGPWTDFYALGATLYKLLSNIETLPSYLDIRYGYEFAFPNSVSERTRALIVKLMQPEIENRPKSVGDIRSFLINYGSVPPQSVPPQQQIIGTQKQKSGHNPMVIIASIVALALLLVGVALLINHDSSESKDITEELITHRSVNLKGTIDKYPITVSLNIDGSKVIGSYYYNKQGANKSLYLTGTLNGDELILDEFDEYSKNTGHFYGHYSNGIYQGNFTTSGIIMTFHITETN